MSSRVLEDGWLQGGSHHPSALTKIKDLEAPRSKEQEPEVVYEVPTFVEHLNDVEIDEGERAVFKCKVQPARDPTIKIGREIFDLREMHKQNTARIHGFN